MIRDNVCPPLNQRDLMHQGGNADASACHMFLEKFTQSFFAGMAQSHHAAENEIRQIMGSKSVGKIFDLVVTAGYCA